MIHDATSPLRDAAPSMTWVREPQLHLTLKFFGEQPPEVADRVGGAMAKVASRHKHVPFTIGGVGGFPNLRRPRVVWMGIAQNPRLELLHHDVEVACEAEGFEIDARPFRPHLTLARTKGRSTIDELRALARAAKRVKVEAESVVESIDLMASELSSTGSTYRVLSASRLRSD